MPTEPTKYLLDSNVFIEAHRRYYAFDLCPGFWDSLQQHHDHGRVLSIDKVRSEMGTGDILDHWVEQTAPATLFATTQTAPVVAEFTTIVRWVQNNLQFLPEAKAEFADVADGWLAAYAKAHSYTVVTQEVHRPEQRNRVPLPNVCLQFGVPYTDTFTMLRTLGARFSLQT
jgi:hypothetical protein